MPGPNGASPGFNADERAQHRESGPVVIGGRTYHARRLTNKKLREVRKLARRTGREAEALAKETDEYRDAFERARGDGKDEKEAGEVALEEGLGADDVQEMSSHSLATQLTVLLVDDGGQPVPEDVMLAHLDEDLDSRDVEGLMGYLLGSPDPTETTTTSAS